MDQQWVTELKGQRAEKQRGSGNRLFFSPAQRAQQHINP